MKKKRVVGFFLLIVFALFMAGGVFLYLNFKDISKNITEQLASEALGVQVRIDSLDVSLKDKEVTAIGIRIFNPPGFAYSHIATVNKVEVGLKSISKKLIDFDHINVDGVIVNLEVNEQGNNLQAFQKLIQKREKRPKLENEHAKVIVRKISIGDSILNPRVTLLGNDVKSPKVTIPPVSLSGIGVRENGVVAKDAVTQVAKKYLMFAEKKAGGEGLLKSAGDVKKVIDDARGNVKKIGDDLTKGLSKSLGGLFGE